ncbi:putative bifunctional diguanylate cyclase/phosphodiesterase [Streptomyces sp. NPDC007088]|uniref:putative bifunctional diguanylate cyclase/phosphodiesterase n=1 Tax=Streptomyces sp. NPDC007088 TaxID=3364773 RepID=UPI0036B68E03
MNGTSEGPSVAAGADLPGEDGTGLPAAFAARPPAPGDEPGGHPLGLTECDDPGASPGVGWRAVFASAPLPMAVVDAAGRIVSANASLRELFAVGPEGLTGRSAGELTGLVADPRSARGYQDLLRGRRTRLCCVRRLRLPAGRVVWAQVSVDRVAGEDTVLLSVHDVSLRHELRTRLRHAHREDPVTRLTGRAYFLERLARALEDGARRGDVGRVGLCCLGLDGFEALNATFGHRVGDRLLRMVGERLTGCARAAAPRPDKVPLVARLGGDEFGLLIEDCRGQEQVTALAESALRAVREPFVVAGRRLSLSASAGVVERHACETSPADLMRAATATLRWSKSDGRDRWTLFDAERHERCRDRQVLSAALRPAVEDGQFELEYQPLVALKDGTLHGVEALVRWRHPRLGRLAPGRFIELAEQDGSIVPLGRWVLRTACAQARAWQRDHPLSRPVFVSVNVAVRQLWDSDLVGDVATVLKETGLSPELLQLELTESAVVGQTGRPLRALQELSDMGVRIAIDDFGTGYSNLSYLSRLPVSVLKLDGSFVRGFPYEAGDGGTSGDGEAHQAEEVIVQALVELAHRLGLTVTAECVETRGQAERLRGMGCDTGQGWLYSRPVPPDRIGDLLETTGCCPGWPGSRTTGGEDTDTAPGETGPGTTD